MSSLIAPSSTKLSQYRRAEDYNRAKKKWRGLVRATDAAMDDFDVLIYPSALGDPPKLDDIEPSYYLLETPMITAPANAAAVQTASVRAGFSKAGLPTSIQISGRHIGDAEVVRVGYACERATPELSRRAR